MLFTHQCGKQYLRRKRNNLVFQECGVVIYLNSVATRQTNKSQMHVGLNNRSTHNNRKGLKISVTGTKWWLAYSGSLSDLIAHQSVNATGSLRLHPGFCLGADSYQGCPLPPQTFTVLQRQTQSSALLPFRSAAQFLSLYGKRVFGLDGGNCASRSKALA